MLEHHEAAHASKAGSAYQAVSAKQAAPETLSSQQSAASHTPLSTISSTGRHGRFSPADTVILRKEHLPDGHAKALISTLRLTTLVGLAAVIYLFIAKFRVENSYFFQRNILQVWNVVTACLGLVAVLLTLAGYSLCLWRVTHAGKRWTHRRRLQAQLAVAELTIQAVNLVFYLVPNAYTLTHACSQFSRVVNISGVMRWSCWNSLFLLTLVHGHTVCPWGSPFTSLTRPIKAPPPRSDLHSEAVRFQIVMDAGLAFHARKLPLWVAIQALLAAFLVWLIEPNHQGGNCQIDQGRLVPGAGCRFLSIPPGTEHDCRQWVVDCREPHAVRIYTGVLFGLLAIYFLLYTFFIASALYQLSQAPYAEFRQANLAVRLQLHIRMLAFTFMMLGYILLWFVRQNSCTAYLEVWLGLCPLQLVMTALVICNAFLNTPAELRPNQALTVWLQEFSMTESDKPAKMAQRGMPDEPMFCFETMLKLQYWAALGYGFMEGAFVKQVEGNLELAMALYGLEHSTIIWERRGDTHVLLAWGSDTLVVAFRGTASMANVLADVQAWRVRHPVAEGKAWLQNHPMVHAGFLASWHANGLHQRVLQQVEQIISERKASAPPCQVFVTGHSLGGALANLCSLDIHCQLADKYSMQICCYAFGAPRVGNHAFARVYDKAVPDTWHVINAQDAVATEGKFLWMYKRPGHRVYVNARGDLIVRPCLVEFSVRRVPGGSSVNQHLLASYRRSMAAIVNAQFTRKGFQVGQQGILQIAANPHMQQVLESCLGVDMAALRQLRPAPLLIPADPEGDCPQTTERSNAPCEVDAAGGGVDGGLSGGTIPPDRDVEAGLAGPGGPHISKSAAADPSGVGAASMLMELLPGSMMYGPSSADRGLAMAGAVIGTGFRGAEHVIRGRHELGKSQPTGVPANGLKIQELA